MLTVFGYFSFAPIVFRFSPSLSSLSLLDTVNAGGCDAHRINCKSINQYNLHVRKSLASTIDMRFKACVTRIFIHTIVQVPNVREPVSAYRDLAVTQDTNWIYSYNSIESIRKLQIENAQKWQMACAVCVWTVEWRKRSYPINRSMPIRNDLRWIVHGHEVSRRKLVESPVNNNARNHNAAVYGARLWLQKMASGWNTKYVVDQTPDNNSEIFLGRIVLLNALHVHRFVALPRLRVSRCVVKGAKIDSILFCEMSVHVIVIICPRFELIYIINSRPSPVLVNWRSVQFHSDAYMPPRAESHHILREQRTQATEHHIHNSIYKLLIVSGSVTNDESQRLMAHDRQHNRDTHISTWFTVRLWLIAAYCWLNCDENGMTF